MRGARFAGLASLFILIALAGQPAGAQTRVGLRAGMNVASVSSDSIGSLTGSHNGVVGGAFVAIPISPVMAFNLGAQFTQKGFELQFPGAPAIAIKINYVEIPALLELMIRSTGALGAHVYVGPSFAFKLSCKLSLNESGSTLTENCEDDSNQGLLITSFDLGATAGGGITLDMGPAALLADVLYTLGLSNINDDNTDGDNVKNRVLSVTAGLSIPISD